MATTRLCWCWLRSSFSLFVISPIHAFLLATNFAAIALGQVTTAVPTLVIVSQLPFLPPSISSISQTTDFLGLDNLFVLVLDSSASTESTSLITSQPLPSTVSLVPFLSASTASTSQTTNSLGLVTSQPFVVVTAAPPIPSGSTVSTLLLIKTLTSEATKGGSSHISKISVFITVTSASPTPPAPSSSTLPPATKKESKKGLSIGLGVGVPALCFLIILAIWLIFRHRRKKRASGGGNIPFIAESRSQPMKNNQQPVLPFELSDNKLSLRELAEERGNPSPLASRAELPTNSPPLAEMRGD